ncbi:MAG: hypothetical protein WAW91_00985, partial [Candidatus Nanoperiomorbaceae bacterium]
LAVSFCEFCKAGQAIKTTRKIKPAIARTNATSMIVKPLIPPPHWVGGMDRVGRVAQLVTIVVVVVIVAVVAVFVVAIIIVVVTVV